MTGYSTIGLQVTSPLGEKDEVYYWDTARFLIEGCVFKLPKYQFVVGSEYFAKTYLQDDARCATPALDPDDDWDSMDVTDEPRLRTSTAGSIELEDVTAAQFRTFLKLLFPVHSTTTTLNLTRSEWLTILTLSTRWRFLEFRKLALSHLEPQMDEAVEMITVGRRDFVPEWVLRGYEMLVLKEEAISEEESEQIGYRAAVKLYIVKEGMVDGEKGQVRQRVEEKFADELMWLRGEERARRTSEEVRIEEEELKRKMEEEERMAREEEQRRAREEEEQRVWEEEERRSKEEEERRSKEEEEQRVREEEERRTREAEEQRAMEEEERRVREAEEEERIAAAAKREDMERKIKQEEERIAEEKKRKEEERNALIERHLQEELARLVYHENKRRWKEEQAAEYERLQRIAAEEERARVQRQQQEEAYWRKTDSRSLRDIISGIGRVLPHMPAPAPSEAEKAAWEASFRKAW